MKKFYIHTFGCQMNVYDGQRIAAMLTARGYESTETVADADIIILNTCAVRAKATDKVFSALGRIRAEKKPDALFGIVGCVARESGADAFRRVPELNFVLGPQSYHKLPAILENPETKLLNIDLGGLEKFDELPQMEKSPVIAYIPIQEGCNHCCTYCIVPYTRGRELSRPFNDVMRDTEHAAKTGAVEICFLGQNVNGYKYTDADGTVYRLSDLIAATAKLDAVKRIRFTSSYPTEMTDDLIDMFRTEPKLLPFLNLPIQSGSPDVLTRMNRPYSLNLYIDIVDKLKHARPDIQISSDFIVGFPGETDADFEQTMKIAQRVKYINSYSFKYSPRPHTAAALMPNQIPESVKSARLAKLDAYLNELQRDFNLSCVGKTMPCLYEGPDKTGRHLVYRTPYMQPCIVDAKSDTAPIMAEIEITDANKASLRGKLK
ncbi:MAG TPA: tRNA (N6-isopentenyl adenosine(37)-C2)-methylthiotransferase MiaB [Candidatus Enterousia intestinigallinarum]|uniref:tRNA-2-methylthio-N(6)-dimethylallyladenosine synthase n=1 Tax=Candidatus Enterousia intestinigallinarum TaxID=2840790 RepID=A0A9D1FGZ8_9PROT|nr:tRNA (N6-isopentenyl adenosine(37)-C2)-methylthiotransferase MiaB [Candidatus Enterousia intestinigallinarum]